MERDLEYRQQMIEEYRRALDPLLKYLPWMERNGGKTSAAVTRGRGSVRIPSVFRCMIPICWGL